LWSLQNNHEVDKDMEFEKKGLGNSEKVMDFLEVYRPW
jgi:hypothetical protein